MLLPDKHIRIAESVLGLAGLVAHTLREPMTLDQLMSAVATTLEQDWKTQYAPETVNLALCFLFSTGQVDVTPQGDLRRCD